MDFAWEVLPELFGSDHFPILLRSAECGPRSRLPRWRLDKADWPLYEELCSPTLLVDDFNTSDAAVEYFTELLHSAALRSIPRTSGIFPCRPVPW